MSLALEPYAGTAAIACGTDGHRKIALPVFVCFIHL
jgi:hypothetical protein